MGLRSRRLGIRPRKRQRSLVRLTARRLGSFPCCRDHRFALGLQSCFLDLQYRFRRVRRCLERSASLPVSLCREASLERALLRLGYPSHRHCQLCLLRRCLLLRLWLPRRGFRLLRRLRRCLLRRRFRLLRFLRLQSSRRCARGTASVLRLHQHGSLVGCALVGCVGRRGSSKHGGRQVICSAEHCRQEESIVLLPVLLPRRLVR